MGDTLLNSRYRLETELGQGGMGVVYRAHDTLLERDVAVKVLSKAALGTEGRARLLREARAAAGLWQPLTFDEPIACHVVASPPLRQCCVAKGPRAAHGVAAKTGRPTCRFSASWARSSP